MHRSIVQRIRSCVVVLTLVIGATVGSGASPPARAVPATTDVPPFTVQVVPDEVASGAPVLVEVRLLGDPEANMAFADATPAMDDLVVARREGDADVGLSLHRVGPDNYWAIAWLPPGTWSITAPRGDPGDPEAFQVSVAGGEGSTPCPVTIPGTAPESFAARLFGSGAAVGNDDLWVGGLGMAGVMVGEGRMIGPDGSVGWKLGWWRLTPGALAITGRRLDADVQPLLAQLPDGYGTQGFQATGVLFPTEGCWEVTGDTGGEPLRFVTYVMRR